MQISKTNKDLIKNSKPYHIIIISFFSALTAVFSQISIPVGVIPINLSILAVFLSAGLLGVYKGVLSQIVYVLIGIVGVPVFAGFSGGVAVIIGPTGGYIIGYIFAALTISVILLKFNKKTYHIVLALTSGLIVCYIFGTFWFSISTNTSFINSLILCVYPFIVADFIKVIVSTLLICKINKVINIF